MSFKQSSPFFHIYFDARFSVLLKLFEMFCDSLSHLIWKGIVVMVYMRFLPRFIH